MLKVPRWDYNQRKSRIWSAIWGRRFSSRRRKNICFRIKSLSMADYNIMGDLTKMMCWIHGFYSITKHGFSYRTYMWITRNGFNYVHTHMRRCTTYIYKYRFKRHDRMTNKMMIRFCWNTENKIRHLDEMCIWLGTNLTHKTPETMGSLLEELGRCLDDRRTLSDKKLHSVSIRQWQRNRGAWLRKIKKR